MSIYILDLSYLGSVVPSPVLLYKAAPKSKFFLFSSLGSSVSIAACSSRDLLEQLWQLHVPKPAGRNKRTQTGKGPSSPRKC